MNEYAEALLSATTLAMPKWVRRSVETVAKTAGVSLTDSADVIDVAAADATTLVSGRLRALFDTDVDRQRTNPLEILRGAVPYPTSVLVGLGVQPLSRHQFETERFPDDIYGLTPATWADIDESLYEPGIIWGAWKAKTILDRRRAQGMR